MDRKLAYVEMWLSTVNGYAAILLVNGTPESVTSTAPGGWRDAKLDLNLHLGMPFLNDDRLKKIDFSRAVNEMEYVRGTWHALALGTCCGVQWAKTKAKAKAIYDCNTVTLPRGRYCSGPQRRAPCTNHWC